ncbi:MAG: peptidase C39 [Acinetobacter gandensis]|uniref:peptidase C39 n=1 Tax=Acinetobacter gandensis TaxID=1443941 RepID=UPI003CFE37B9
MSIDIPEDLQNLEANGGIYAIWMIFHHYGVDLDITDLVQLCRYNNQDGTFGIALAVGLKKLGLDVDFFTEHDPEQHQTEIECYLEANELNIPVNGVLGYQEIQQLVEAGRFVIVYYDTLEGVGNHSLIYSMDEHEICFFDSFDAMSAGLFQQQREQPGICQQVIVIDDRNFVMRAEEFTDV